MNIETRIRKARDKIAKGQLELKAAQDECAHPGLQGKYGSDTGNWCPSDDSYWIDLKCPVCDKRWSVDSDDDDYQQYGKHPHQKYHCEIVEKL